SDQNYFHDQWQKKDRVGRFIKCGDADECACNKKSSQIAIANNERGRRNEKEERIRFRLRGIGETEREQRKREQNTRDFGCPLKRRNTANKQIHRPTCRKRRDIIRKANRKLVLTEEPFEERIGIEDIGRLDVPGIDIGPG